MRYFTGWRLEGKKRIIEPEVWLGHCQIRAIVIDGKKIKFELPEYGYLLVRL